MDPNANRKEASQLVKILNDPKTNHQDWLAASARKGELDYEYSQWIAKGGVPAMTGG